MITIDSAESALKNIYLDVVVNDINTKTNPFLTMVQKNTKTVSGKDAKAVIRYGDDGSVAAGSEDGNLPVASNSKFAEIVTPLKNLYGTFQITDKAIKAAQNNAGAFASLLSGEMQNLIGNAQKNLNRMVYGNGTPYLAYTTKIDAPGKKVTVPLKFLGNFQIGTKFKFLNSANEAPYAAVATVTAIDTATGEITFTNTFIVAATKYDTDRLYLIPAEASGEEMNGIDSIFVPGKMYNLNTADCQGILPCKVAPAINETSLGILNEDALISFFDKYEEHCQGVPADILLTHPNVRKALFENLKDFRSNVDVTEMAGGFKGFTFNGIPMYADIKCKAGTLYALNSDSWSMNQLCDWTWLTGDDGSILKQVDNKPVYSATLVKYADLICEKPFLQGAAMNYDSVKYKA